MRIAGLVKFAFGHEPSQRAQGGEDLSTVRLTDLTAIFVIGAIANIVIAVFDAPVAAGDIEQAFGVGLLLGPRSEAGNGQDGFLSSLTAFEVEEVSANAKHLGRTVEADLFGFYAQSPDLPNLEAAVVFFSALSLRRMLRGERRDRGGAVPFPAPRADCLLS